MRCCMTDLCPTILIIEDELSIRRVLCATLQASGYQVIAEATAQEGCTQAAMRQPALILLDLGLPDLDGLEVTRRLREWATMPIIVLSARGREADKVAALDAGADDYLTKPFGLDELLARMRVALRHARESGTDAAPPVLTIGEVTIDLQRREVTRGGAPVRLTPIEFRLLAFLAKHAGRIVTHHQILNEIWGGTASAEPHHVRVHMADLRKKLEDDPARPKLLLTELGVGYRLKE